MKRTDIFDLTDKIAVVTGGAGHIGYAISECLAEAGTTVFIVSRNVEKCLEVSQKISELTNSAVHAMKMDIQSTDSINNCFNQIVKNYGRIDILVNNACFSAGKQLSNMSEDDWKTGIEGTINSVFRCTKCAIPFMEKNKSGSIINISSMYGVVSPDPSIYGDSGFDNPPNYGAGKAAIIQFTRYAACHLATKGIRVNAVSPGPFPNPKVQKNQLFISKLVKKVPLGRIGHPNEIKGVILLLASDASSYITGANIPVDGGWTAW